MKSKCNVFKFPGRFEFETRDISIEVDELMVRVSVSVFYDLELNHFNEIIEKIPVALSHERVG